MGSPVVAKSRAFPKKQAGPHTSSDPYQQRMSPSARVSLAADMSSVAAEIMMDNIRHRHPGISNEKVLEKARKRLYRTGK